MLELVLDTLLPAADGKDVEVVVEGVLVPVDSEDVLVVPVRVLVVVEEESYCKETDLFRNVATYLQTFNVDITRIF